MEKRTLTGNIRKDVLSIPLWEFQDGASIRSNCHLHYEQPLCTIRKRENSRWKKNDGSWNIETQTSVSIHFFFIFSHLLHLPLFLFLFSSVDLLHFFLFSIPVPFSLPFSIFFSRLFSDSILRRLAVSQLQCAFRARLNCSRATIWTIISKIFLLSRWNVLLHEFSSLSQNRQKKFANTFWREIDLDFKSSSRGIILYTNLDRDPRKIIVYHARTTSYIVERYQENNRKWYTFSDFYESLLSRYSRDCYRLAYIIFYIASYHFLRNTLVA